ncbi:MAG: hypothetical protein ACUVQH_09075, partial [Thermogutta sp.]
FPAPCNIHSFQRLRTAQRAQQFSPGAGLQFSLPPAIMREQWALFEQASEATLDASGWHSTD